MRHQVAGRKLGRTTEHRWALFCNMLSSLVMSGRIETTLCKAKELRSFADHLVTLGKQDTLWARRQAFNYVRDKAVITKLFTELAPRFKERNGGYTRVLKLGYRLGDSAPMALIEYLPGQSPLTPITEMSKKERDKKKGAEPHAKLAEKPKKEKVKPKKEPAKKAKEEKAQAKETEAKKKSSKSEKASEKASSKKKPKK